MFETHYGLTLNLIVIVVGTDVREGFPLIHLHPSYLTELGVWPCVVLCSAMGEDGTGRGASDGYYGFKAEMTDT